MKYWKEGSMWQVWELLTKHLNLLMYLVGHACSSQQCLYGGEPGECDGIGGFEIIDHMVAISQ